MLRQVADLIGYDIHAKDGNIGEAKDLLFDDQRWTVRYLVVDTIKWLPGRKVLVRPGSLHQPDWDKHRFPVDLTKDEVKASPPLSADQPVSRQHETDLHKHFGWHPYWMSRSPGDRAVQPGQEVNVPPEPEMMPESESRRDADAHLRSAKEVMGYDLVDKDQQSGRVVDIIVDDENWIVRYFTV
ncbi:PRC-barrel domain containing protein [candidate division GN15 bacterium]|nr:PRC-barrel domain containing protein [candidate division GN15 bacterium]